jgi:hypothetical protein
LESDLRKRYGTYPRTDDKPESKVNKKGFWARLFG